MSLRDLASRWRQFSIKDFIKKVRSKRNYRYLLLSIIAILAALVVYEKMIIYKLEGEITRKDFRVKALREHNSKLIDIVKEGQLPEYLDKPKR